MKLIPLVVSFVGVCALRALAQASHSCALPLFVVGALVALSLVWVVVDEYGSQVRAYFSGKLAAWRAARRAAKVALLADAIRAAQGPRS